MSSFGNKRKARIIRTADDDDDVDHNPQITTTSTASDSKGTQHSHKLQSQTDFNS